MGTRIHVFVSHDLPSVDDAASVIEHLDRALPQAMALGAHWEDTVSSTGWLKEPLGHRLPHLHRYAGPGSLWVDLTPAAARISTGGRWRGFLSIEPLRRVHLDAFIAIAAALGSSRMAICHDSTVEPEDAFVEGRSNAEVVESLHREIGPPQPTVTSIDMTIIRETEHGVPNVWYLEAVPTRRTRG